MPCLQIKHPSCSSSAAPNAIFALVPACPCRRYCPARHMQSQGLGRCSQNACVRLGLCNESVVHVGCPHKGDHQCRAVQDAHLSRPQPKTAGVKEIMEAHPYVNMDPQQQVHMYRVSSRDSDRLLLASPFPAEMLKSTLCLESHVNSMSRLECAHRRQQRSSGHSSCKAVQQRARPSISRF